MCFSIIKNIENKILLTVEKLGRGGGGSVMSDTEQFAHEVYLFTYLIYNDLALFLRTKND